MNKRNLYKKYWLKVVCLGLFFSAFVVLLAVQADAVNFSQSSSRALAYTPVDPVRFSGDTMIVNTKELGKNIQGYAGAVPLDVYILNGKVAKVVALPNSETPGFFANAAALLGSWVGLTPKQALDKKVDAISGATYSSEAIIENVRVALEYVKNVDMNAVGATSMTGDPVRNGFKKINVMSTEDLPAGFSFYTGDNGHGLLLCSGDKQNSNAMTIGWGSLGTLWGRRPTVTVYVAEKRYTREYMDKYEYFTIMHFPDNRVVDYMGTHSGRDGDKAQALGLHTLYTENGTPYYAEADLVIECRMMYGGEQFDPKYYRSDVPRKRYENFPAGIHFQYIGEVVGAWKR
ncbi:MAG: FMN-binding protein [Bacteroidales bacterium]|nr:FMN-binding protein [Bacteroidales bacterium]